MSRNERILSIMQELKPSLLELKNESDKHSSHVEHLGAAGFTGETHYKLIIVSELFEGKSRIDRSRMVTDLLKEEFKSGLHALEIKAKSPREALS